MALQYQYCYAKVRESDGLCLGGQDSSTYILNRAYVPIEHEFMNAYVLKYYWPLPETVTSHDDFQGQWYSDAAHTQIFEAGNA